MKSKEPAYMLYCWDRELRAELERALAAFPVRQARSRTALKAPPANIRVTVYATETCTEREARWLLSMFEPPTPPCVVVTGLSLDCMRRLHSIDSARLKVVWAAEARDRLRPVLEELWMQNWSPMGRFGLGLLDELKPMRDFLRQTIRIACGLHVRPTLPPFVPRTSVARLAAEVGVATSTLRLCWREEVPLQCNVKGLLGWSLVLWGTRQRTSLDWAAIAGKLRMPRRTLERNFIRTAGCTLAEAADDSERVDRRFTEWVGSVWDPDAVRGPGAGHIVAQDPTEGMR